MNGPSWTLDDIIAALNRMLAADPAAVSLLLSRRVPCNDTLRDDPACQVTVYLGEASVSALGFINGLFGVEGDGWGRIAAIYDGPKILRFEKVDASKHQLIVRGEALSS